MNYWYIGFVLLLAGILFWRLVLPGMKLVGTAQTAGPAAANKSPPEKKVPWGWVIGIPLAILVGLGLWWSLPWHSPSLATVRDGIWSSWLYILIVCGIVLVVAIFVGDKLKTALRTAVWGVVAMSFIVIPLLAWVVADPVLVKSTAERTIPMASAPQETWPSITIGPGGKSDRLPAPPGMRVVVKGNNFLSHYVYADGNECSFGSNCPADIIALYFTNTSKTSPTLVMYAYEK